MAGVKKTEEVEEGKKGSNESQVKSLKNILETSAPLYKEEDIEGLCIKGTSVYDSEKKSLLNTIDELINE